MMLKETEQYLAEKEATWREERSRCYDEFVILLKTGRTLTRSRAMLDILDKLEDLQCRMANGDTVRFIGNGLRTEAMQREFGARKQDDAEGTIGPVA